MNRGAKIALASAVLLFGVAAAFVYRHPSPPPTSTKPTRHDQMALRQWREPADLPPLPPVRVAEMSPPRPGRTEPRAALAETKPPPMLSPEYPLPSNSPLRGWEGVPPYQLPEPADSRPALRIHKVADGDTLPLLAERYLGSVDRIGEIIEVNRDVLTSPDALPIGIELRIPPRSTSGAAKPYFLPEQPLVPVRP
ncbi:MAG TPA: hypothetical protein DD670_01285 [Planctomycetaceae bacterium]|nr:hypothetical protein [Planctomycetaceae bacterium]